MVELLKSSVVAVSGEKCESIILEYHTKIRSGISFHVTSQGAQSLLTGPWVHMTCDFSRFSENMRENYHYLLILTLGGGTRPIIFGLDRNQGANLTQIEPWSLRWYTFLFHLAVKWSQKWYRKDIQRRQWMMEWGIITDPVWMQPSDRIWNNSLSLWAVTITYLLNYAKIINWDTASIFPTDVCP